MGDDGTVELLPQLREQRAFLCRLSPGRALGSVEEADTFLRDRGLLTLLAPIKRVTGYDTIVPLAKLEHSYLPTPERIAAAARETLEAA